MAGTLEPGIVSDRDQAYVSLRSLILSGKLEPGSEISQTDLVGELSLGRTPIRDAISRLRNDGLVDYEVRSRRWVVRPVSPEELDDLYATRIVLEPFVAGLAVESLSQKTLDDLRTSLDASSEALRARDMAAFPHYHRSFHLALASGSGSQSQKVVEDLWDLAERYRRLMLTDLPNDENVVTTVCQHERIMDAVVSRNPEAVSRAVAVHLGTTARQLFVIFGPRFRPVAVEKALSERGLSLSLSEEDSVEGSARQDEVGEGYETA